MTPRAKPQKDWIVTAGQYAVAVAAMAGVVSGAIALIVRPMIAEEATDRRANELRIQGDIQSIRTQLSRQLLLAGRTRIDLLDLIATRDPGERERKLTQIRQRLEQEAQSRESKEEP